jgi:hypothetical protein
MAVLDKFGLATLYPDLADEALPAPAARERALDRIDRNLSIHVLGDSTVLVAEFRHEDPALARDVLAAAIEVYRANRAKAFGGTDSAVAEAQLERAETRLAQARDKVAEFRDANDAWLLESDALLPKQTYGDWSWRRARPRRRPRNRARSRNDSRRSWMPCIPLRLDPGRCSTCATSLRR